jgi:HTH-type transcriptional repressor of NAD biosynthesis genes
MIRGLVIGKFLPIHKGHIALINFAASHCDELIVSMSYRDDDPIKAGLRFGWIETIFKNNPSIKPFMIADDFDNPSLPLTERTKVWAEIIKKHYPKIDVLVSSEDYGEPFASNLGAKYISFDPYRKDHPVSATLIREKPFRYWDFIPAEVRPHFVKKICFYGPESTGKSFMAKKMAEYFNTEYVPEVARELITSNDFTIDDIIRIGKSQTQRVFEKSKIANKVLFCDTDVITTQIYSQHYLKTIPPILVELENQIQYDHYFFFDIDVPWVNDGLRDLGDKREEMLVTFRRALTLRGINPVDVAGDYQERERLIKKVVSEILMSN